MKKIILLMVLAIPALAFGQFNLGTVTLSTPVSIGPLTGLDTMGRQSTVAIDFDAMEIIVFNPDTSKHDTVAFYRQFASKAAAKASALIDTYGVTVGGASYTNYYFRGIMDSINGAMTSGFGSGAIVLWKQGEPTYNQFTFRLASYLSPIVGDAMTLADSAISAATIKDSTFRTGMFKGNAFRGAMFASGFLDSTKLGSAAYRMIARNVAYMLLADTGTGLSSYKIRTTSSNGVYVGAMLAAVIDSASFANSGLRMLSKRAAVGLLSDTTNLYKIQVSSSNGVFVDNLADGVIKSTTPANGAFTKDVFANSYWDSSKTNSWLYSNKVVYLYNRSDTMLDAKISSRLAPTTAGRTLLVLANGHVYSDSGGGAGGGTIDLDQVVRKGDFAAWRTNGHVDSFNLGYAYFAAAFADTIHRDSAWFRESVLNPILPTNFPSLSITSGGNVGIDWGNIANKTTTNALTGTTISSSQHTTSDSVKGNVGGSVKGNVEGDVRGYVVKDVQGNVGGSVQGDVAGGVGYVAGNVGGDVIGNVGGVTAPVTTSRDSDIDKILIKTQKLHFDANDSLDNVKVGTASLNEEQLKPIILEQAIAALRSSGDAIDTGNGNNANWWLRSALNGYKWSMTQFDPTFWMDGVGAYATGAESLIIHFAGTGSDQCTLVVLGPLGEEIQNAKITIWTKSRATVKIPRLYTDVNGSAIWAQDPDSFYIGIIAQGYNSFGEMVALPIGGLTDTIYMTAFDVRASDDPTVCRVYGNIVDITGHKVKGATVTFTLQSDSLYPGAGGNYTYRPAVTVRSDSSGLFYCDLIPNVSLTDTLSKYIMSINYLNSKIFEDTISVPDSSTHMLTR